MTTILVDGTNINDTARISGFKLARDGSFVYLRARKGPKARIELIQDGETVTDWPRGQLLRTISLDREGLILSQLLSKDNATAFYRFKRGADGRISPEAEQLGIVKNCAIQSARRSGDKLLLQAYCSHEKGSDLLSFDMKSGEVTPILASGHDEHFGSSLLRVKGAVPVLKVDGNTHGKRAFYAINSIFLSSLGEPLSMASDEAGSQSWGQSFRLRTLAALSNKTGHPVFSALAHHSMTQTLAQQNGGRGVTGANNPSCGWASRIYSSDHKSPISLLVNQGMIAASLIKACEQLGSQCPMRLRDKVMGNARCLVDSFEETFDKESGLYRIPFGAPFRFDGIWAPWNWQLAFAPVLEAVGQADERPDLTARAHDMARQFTDSWEHTGQGALWRYWTQDYYAGWTEADRISKARPMQKPLAPRRYEDISHAGISLMGLASLRLGFAKGPHRGSATNHRSSPVSWHHHTQRSGRAGAA